MFPKPPPAHSHTIHIGGGGKHVLKVSVLPFIGVSPLEEIPHLVVMFRVAHVKCMHLFIEWFYCCSVFESVKVWSSGISH